VWCIRSSSRNGRIASKTGNSLSGLWLLQLNDLADRGQNQPEDCFLFCDLVLKTGQLEPHLACRIERIHIRNRPIALDQFLLYSWDVPFLLVRHGKERTIKTPSSRHLKTKRLLHRGHVRLSLESKFSEV